MPPSGIPFEILEELYLPKSDSTLSYGGRISSKYEQLIDELEYEALSITQNLPSDSRANKIGGRTEGLLPSKWRPAGNIQLWDDASSASRPVVGAKVNATRFFDVVSGLTDNAGNFVCDGEFRYDANYSIKWERADYDIRSQTFGQAIFNGPNMKGNWNLTITGGLSRMYAIVHQAAHDYYYGNRLGLKSPPKNGFWNASLKIAVYDSENDDANGSHCKDCRIFGALPSLYIYNPNRTVDQIYGTTIHELAHASHWELRRNNWNENNLELKVAESWARGVQWALGRLRYLNYRGGQTNRPDYTQVVVDMVDSPSEDPFNNGAGFPQDQVQGYSMKQIEDVLHNTSSFEIWKINLQNTYDNPTEANLEALFNFWNQ